VNGIIHSVQRRNVNIDIFERWAAIEEEIFAGAEWISISDSAYI